MARSKSRGAPAIRDMPLEDEAAEQCLLHHPLSAHHRPNLLHPAEEKSAPGAPIKQSFSGQFALTGRLGST
jgi:hypothetical protein